MAQGLVDKLLTVKELLFCRIPRPSMLQSNATDILGHLQ